MKTRFYRSFVNSMIACVAVAGFASPSLAQWTVTTPANNSTFTTTSRVSGIGVAPTNNTTVTFSFSYVNDGGIEIFENTTNVTSYQKMPGQFRWATIATELQCDADGWKKTEYVMGQNGQIIKKYTHDANIDDGSLMWFTSGHMVQ